VLFGYGASFYLPLCAVFGFFPWHRPLGQVWTFNWLFTDIHQNHLEYRVTGLECLLPGRRNFLERTKASSILWMMRQTIASLTHRIEQYEILFGILASTSRSSATDQRGLILLVYQSLTHLFDYFHYQIKGFALHTYQLKSVSFSCWIVS
jgi:hypothetical protein